MDAGALLRRQGWRGDGHALSQSGNGIKKPLLISKKVDVLGVGLNKHAAVSDQWWMRAFDQGLKDLGTGKKSTLSTVREKGIHFGGLYGRFVKGETVQGTIEDNAQKKGGEEDEAMAGPKRKRDDEPEKRAGKKRKFDKSESKSGMKKRGSAGQDDMRSDTKRKASISDGETGADEKSKGVKQISKDLYGGQTEAFLAEAIRRGLITPNPRKPTATHILTPIHTEEAILQVFANAGLKKATNTSKTSKEAKILRTKDERALKRAAKQYLFDILSPEQRKGLDEAEENRPQSALHNQQAENAAAEELAEQRKQRRKRKQLEPATAQPKDTSAHGDDSNFNVVDKNGEVRWTGAKNEPVPLDPTIWEHVKIKTLPKPVREARRKWMQEQREARNPTSNTSTHAISRSQRKAERRQKMVMSILRRSRAARQDGIPDLQASVDGIENVPHIKVETMKGPYTPDEMSRARTVARKVLKQEKLMAEKSAKKERKTAKQHKSRSR